MSEASMQERTEDATPRKREDARNEGQVPRSQELTTALALLASSMIVNSFGPALAGSMFSTMGYGIVVAGAETLNGEAAVELVRDLGWKVLAALTALVLSVAGVAFASAAIQARGVMSLHPITPQWKRIDPMTNLERLLGVQPWADLAKSLIKLLIVSIVVYVSLAAAWSESMALAQQSPRELIDVIQTYSVRMLRTAGLAYLALAAADYAFQIWQHEKNLRMTKEEVKQEYKQNEGDPLIKAQRRAMGRAFARRQMFQEVPTADVVITNPTHIAVALKYDPERFEAPMVLAMGQRKIAERIKAIARESGVPTVENKPLARALLASARVGTQIPPEMYLAVAEVLAFVMTQRGERPRPRSRN